jgi:hypothetical protein
MAKRDSAETEASLNKRLKAAEAAAAKADAAAAKAAAAAALKQEALHATDLFMGDSGVAFVHGTQQRHGKGRDAFEGTVENQRWYTYII